MTRDARLPALRMNPGALHRLNAAATNSSLPAANGGSVRAAMVEVSDGHVKMTVAAYADATVLPGVLRMPMALDANRTLALSSNQLNVRVLGPLPDQASGMTAQASDLTAPGSPLAGSATQAAAHLSTAGAA